MSEEKTEDERREECQAMVFLDTWGSTTYPPISNGDYGWTENGAPEWLNDLGDDIDPATCLTALCVVVGSDPKPPYGYRLVHTHGCGERECPDCEATGHAYNHETEERDPSKPCWLCEGEGHIYWGDEWVVAVFAPAIVVGAGQYGCLYDYGSERATSMKQAWEGIKLLLPELSRRRLAIILRDLRRDGIHRFGKLAGYVGWDYVEAKQCDS